MWKFKIENKNILSFFFLISLFIFLFFPLHRARADLFGIIDTLSTILEGVEEQSGPLAGKLIFVFVVYIVGLLLLHTASYLLQLTINGQVEWLTLRNSALVQAGWRFVAGLSNLLLIFIFILIAITYILKIETFAAKKALPKLIIVALLLNFSLVFIGIFVDISHIVYRTILAGNENLINEFVDQLGASGVNVLWSLISWLLALIALWANPFGGIAQLAFVVFVLTLIFPNLITWTFQIVLFFSVASMFFTYAFLFAARVFVIQILAIISPIAFVCLILPQTEKYWKEWLHHLSTWLLLGVIVLFLLAIGVRASQQLVPPGGWVSPPPVWGWFSVASYFTYYFFMLIFFIIVLFFSKQFMPAMANFMISQATAFGGMAWARVGKPISEGLKGEARKAAAREEAKGMEKAAKEGKIWGQLSEREKMRYMGVGALTRPISWVYRGAGTSVMEETKKEIAKMEAETAKIQDPNLRVSKLENMDRAGNLEGASAILTQSLKDGGAFKDEMVKKIDVDTALRFARYRNAIGDKEGAERIAGAFLHKIAPPKEHLKVLEENLRRSGLSEEKITEEMAKEVQKYQEEVLVKQGGFKSKNQLSESEQKEWDVKGYKTLTEKIIGDMKPEEVKNLSKGFWENPALLAAAMKFWGGPQIHTAALTFGRSFVVSFSAPIEERLREIKKLPPEEAKREYISTAHKYKKVMRYLETTAAQELGFVSPYAMAPQSVKEEYPTMRDVLAGRKRKKKEEKKEKPPPEPEWKYWV